MNTKYQRLVVSGQGHLRCGLFARFAQKQGQAPLPDRELAKAASVRGECCRRFILGHGSTQHLGGNRNKNKCKQNDDEDKGDRDDNYDNDGNNDKTKLCPFARQ